MKKYILIASIAFSCQMGFAQTVALDSAIIKKKMQKNEIAFNIGDFLVSNRIGLVYERFLHKNHSVLFNVVGFDKIAKPDGSPSPFLYAKAASYGLAYRLYRAKYKPNSGIFISPMVRFRQSFGNVSYKVINENTFELSKGANQLWSAGLGLGAKVSEKRLTFTLQGNLFYNFIPNTTNAVDVYYLEEISQPRQLGFGAFAGFGYRF